MSNDATGITSSLKISFLQSESDKADPITSALDVASRLKLIREAFGFSQRELAKRAGVTNSSISMIEQGQVSPSIQSLSRILSAFPVTLADFFSFALSAEVQSSREEAGQILKKNEQQLDARIEYLQTGQSTAVSVATTDSCGVILNGSLQLTVLNGNKLLNRGDSFYIPARHLFRLINVSNDEASLFRCSLFGHER